MQITKRQHFIPRLHLKNFSGTEPRGHVWTYDAQKDQIRSSLPDQTAFETHFYSVEREDGTMDDSIESALAEIESKAAPIYEELLKGKIPGNTQEKMNFSAFLALMHVRTPAMRRMNAEALSRSIQSLMYAYAIHDKSFENSIMRLEESRGKTLTMEEKDQLRRDLIDPSKYTLEIPKERTLSILGASSKLCKILFNMKWTVVTAQHGFFITSDNPLVREVDPSSYHPIYGDGGFMNKTAEIVSPLSSQNILFLSWHESAHSNVAFDRDQVDMVNRSIAANSDRYLYAHIRHKGIVKLAREFKDSRPSLTTKGFGPKKYAKSHVTRRSNKK